jgi:hypothetical protein
MGDLESKIPLHQENFKAGKKSNRKKSSWISNSTTARLRGRNSNYGIPLFVFTVVGTPRCGVPAHVQRGIQKECWRLGQTVAARTAQHAVPTLGLSKA